MARINDWKVISTPWSYQLLFFPYSFVSLHIFCSGLGLNSPGQEQGECTFLGHKSVRCKDIS
jgi:hypothetical protein